jgi:broad specificity phosphatase PhoE
MNEITRPELLVFIRHAESKRNEVKKGATYFADDAARQIVRGVPDHKVPLTLLGYVQALRTGLALKANFGLPDYIYHSGYARTEQTMDGVLQAYSPEERSRIQVRASPLIRERAPGYTYDMTKDEAERTFPYLKGHWDTFGGFFGCPVGGQSLVEKTFECQLFLSIVFGRRAGQVVFVFTHGGTLRCFRFLLEHWDYDQALAWPPGESPENCGVTVYRTDDSGRHLVLEDYNQVFWK